MAWRSPDRLLKRKLARLARLEPDDLRAVIGELEPAQQRRIEQLLHDAADAPADHPVSALPPTTLSPWLVERIAGDAGLVTPATRAALAQAASWPTSNASGRAGEASRPSLVERGLTALAGTRRTR